jgi:hypothetical protein
VMTAAISASDRERLAKLLGILGSDHAGERDAAGLAAHRLVQASGLTWVHVVCRPQEAPHRDPRGGSLRGDWRATAMTCGPYQHLLNRWEHDFLIGLPRFPRLSVKQSATLIKIVTRLRTCGCAI